MFGSFTNECVNGNWCYNGNKYTIRLLGVRRCQPRFYTTENEGFAGDRVIQRSFRAYDVAGLLLRPSIPLRGMSGSGMVGAADAGEPGLERPSILRCMRELLN